MEVSGNSVFVWLFGLCVETDKVYVYMSVFHTGFLAWGGKLWHLVIYTEVYSILKQM